jgi:hypothetical protein
MELVLCFLKLVIYFQKCWGRDFNLLSIVFSHLGMSDSIITIIIITVLLLGAPMLPTRWVKISTYLQSETFLSITFILINLKLLIMFVHTPNVLCYAVLSYYVLVTTRHLLLFDCLLTFLY